MATKYLVPETAVTEQAGPFWVKAEAVACADTSAAEHPGTTFTVVTGKGTTVHTALTDAPQDTDTEQDDVPAADAPPADGNEDGVQADDEDGVQADDEDGVQDSPDEDEAADSGEGTPDPAPTGTPAELCATNTWANIVHIRRLGEQRTACGSATTSRRASSRQVEEAKRCKFCTAAADKEGLAVDERPAGSGQQRTGTRRKPKTLVVNAGDIRDLVAHLKSGEAYAMELTDGTRLEVRAGDPVTGELDGEGAEASDIRSLTLVSS